MSDLMKTAPCGFVSFSDDGTMDEVNDTLLEMLGFTRIELLGWHIDRILPPGGRIFYQTYLFPLLKVQSSVEEIYLALRTSGGTDVPVLLNGRRQERRGRIFNDCVVVRMTQRHAFEDQLLQARRLAEEASAAKTKFLSMMSHDLRTPLAAIDGNAQLLESGAVGDLSQQQRESVEAIRDACRTQMTLISDLLDFAQLQSGKIQVQLAPVSLIGAVERAHALVKGLMDESMLRFGSIDCGEEHMVMADANRLQQILLNLLTNAIKFTPAGGEISVECRVRDDHVLISVRDTGIGISEPDLSRIFSPFVQVDSGGQRSASLGGVGLGLAICRELARAMGGEVTARSTVGAGSVFTIELAVAPSQEESRPAAVG